MDFFVDTHAHVYLDDFVSDRGEMLRRAREAGVMKIFMPNVDHTSIDAMLELEEKHKEQCKAMMGLHPCYIKKDFERELYLVEDWLSKRKFVAVGEIGTDLYWDKTFWEQQKEAFVIQLKWAIKYKLPAVIHCRESIDETIALVEGLANKDLRGVFHCFSGNVDQAKKIIELGFHLGIGGVATFKKGGLDGVLPEIEMKHLLLETDSPYLAPVPHRGKRNEPAYIPLVASRIADLKKTEVVEVRNQTTINAMNLFEPA
jgi:TatD DNase family protein